MKSAPLVQVNLVYHLVDSSEGRHLCKIDVICLGFSAVATKNWWKPAESDT